MRAAPERSAVFLSLSEFSQITIKKDGVSFSQMIIEVLATCLSLRSVYRYRRLLSAYFEIETAVTFRSTTFIIVENLDC